MHLPEELGATTLWVIIVTIFATIFANRFAEPAFNKFVVRPLAKIYDYFYRKIAPRNPFSFSLRSYKSHVARSELARIENPVGPGLDVPLEKSYAPLRLIASDSQEGNNLDFFQYAADSHRFIVLGGPGTGKTTLMKSLVINVIEQSTRQERLHGLIPIFIVLRDPASRQQTVEEAIIAAFEQYHFPGANKFTESAFGQGRLIVILDGLDEVGASRNFVSSRIQAFCLKIWPFEDRFPAKLAMPMAIAAIGDRGTRNRAIRYAARAMQLKPSWDPAQRRFLKQWERLPRDLAINGGIRSFGKALAAGPGSSCSP
uniref:NACHT domain-containing protein n=1 Tax=Candidatus Kentrum eta TaxID=2126337 RepID=A0A450V2J8_9GAMM|nr:MAG: NACHT domain-containing protein [Candidatus Kentron sp. H]VFJ99294.1 MAG: NACHT domain-containing protein [Candidatus Kentron sp. H]VFK03762.1 MAG: NACHT domain-containing protein [Candidatus Kentron sp. H]